jgi:hypothetical protein
VNWDALQAVSELVAAAGVIVSLIYLAGQVQQNTKLVRAAANQDLLTSFNAVMEFPKISPHGARIYHAIFRGEVAGLDSADRSAVRVGLIQVCRVFEQAYLQHEVGLLDQASWTGWSKQMQLSMGLPGFAQGWPAIRPMMSPGFARWMDGVATSAEAVADDYMLHWDETPFDRGATGETG